MAGKRKSRIKVKRRARLGESFVILTGIQISANGDRVVDQRQRFKLDGLFGFRQGWPDLADSIKVARAVNEMCVRDIWIELKRLFEVTLRLCPIPIVDRE